MRVTISLHYQLTVSLTSRVVGEQFNSLWAKKCSCWQKSYYKICESKTYYTVKIVSLLGIVETTSAVLMISPMVYLGDIRYAYLFLLLTINGRTEITKNTKSAFKAIWVFQARTNLLFDSRYPGCARKGRIKPKWLSDREATGNNAFCFLLSKQDLRISFLMYTSPKIFNDTGQILLIVF